MRIAFARCVFILCGMVLLILAAGGAGAQTGYPLTAPDQSMACSKDTDCAVKTSYSCCGQVPACMNVNATPPDQAEVQKSCGDSIGICGYTEVVGCTCQKGVCTDVTDSEPTLVE